MTSIADKLRDQGWTEMYCQVSKTNTKTGETETTETAWRLISPDGRTTYRPENAVYSSPSADESVVIEYKN